MNTLRTYITSLLISLFLLTANPLIVFADRTWWVDRIEGWRRVPRALIETYESIDEIGDRHVKASILIVQGNDKKDAYRRQEAIFYRDDHRHVFMKTTIVRLVDMVGQLSIASDDADNIIGQFIVVSDKTYVMMCSGDRSAKVRVALACLKILGSVHLPKR